MKKIFLFLMFIAVLVIIGFFAFMLQKTPQIILTDGSNVPPSNCLKIPEVVIIEKQGCPACAIAVPRLEELEKELGKEFKYYDLSVIEEAQQVKELGLIAQFVPTVVIKCKVFVGVKTKEEYKEALEGLG